jgi:hypothetical protein
VTSDGTEDIPTVPRSPISVHRFVIAGRAAGLAVHQAVGAEANVHLGLAQDTKLLAPALGFGLLALSAKDLT